MVRIFFCILLVINTSAFGEKKYTQADMDKMAKVYQMREKEVLARQRKEQEAIARIMRQRDIDERNYRRQLDSQPMFNTEESASIGRMLGEMAATASHGSRAPYVSARPDVECTTSEGLFGEIETKCDHN